MYDQSISNNEICQHLLNAIDNVRTAFVLFDKNGNIKYYNQVFSEIMKTEKTNYINENIFSLLHLKTNLLSHINDKPKIEFAKTLGINSEKVLVNLYFSKCKIKTENIEAYVIINSLTSMERQVDDLLVKELDMQSLLNDSLIGMFVVSQEHKIIRANKAFRDILGYDENEILDKFSWEILEDYTKKTIEKDFADLSKAVNVVKVRFVKKNNDTVNIQVMGKGGRIKGEPVMIYFVDTFPRQ